MWPMFYIESEPMSEVSQLQRTVSRLFDESNAGSAVFPLVNAWTDENETVVTAEVPGVDPKSISVTVTGDLLKIEGEKKAVVEQEQPKAVADAVRRVQISL